MTAVRFHFAELVISVAWRSAQILLIGGSPVSFAARQMFLFPSILFHHSNVRLPVKTGFNFSGARRFRHYDDYAIKFV
jgi:sterol desaturase/sphingolipid hydroxylase (fatty acid hydroxylase superfamily)